MFSQSLAQTFEILARLHEQFEQYGVHELCEALNISRGTCYNHIFRRTDRTEYLQKQRELGLTSIREKAKSSYRSRQEYLKRDLVNREFSVTPPNEIWASDITYFKIKGYAVYLCVIIDLFSRMVVGYRVSRKCSTHLVTATFKDAFRVRGTPTELTLHSDRGGQHTTDTFFKLFRQGGVKQSFSRSGRPCDNAAAETFFASFKREEAYRRDYSSDTNPRLKV